jgi:hypothetical protein
LIWYLFNEVASSQKSKINKTETENSVLYERGDGASVLLKNDVAGGPLPQVSDERISHALDVSLQEGKRVNIISGFRGLDHPLASVNHYKYDASINGVRVFDFGFFFVMLSFFGLTVVTTGTGIAKKNC